MENMIKRKCMSNHSWILSSSIERILGRDPDRFFETFSGVFSETRLFKQMPVLLKIEKSSQKSRLLIDLSRFGHSSKSIWIQALLLLESCIPRTCRFINVNRVPIFVRYFINEPFRWNFEYLSLKILEKLPIRFKGAN